MLIMTEGLKRTCAGLTKRRRYADTQAKCAVNEDRMTNQEGGYP
jgi:hypothetical protein